MKIHTLQKFAVLSAIGLCFSATAMAQVLVNDTFSSGTANSNGYYSYNASGGATQWTVGGGTIDNSDGSAPNTTINKSFTPTTLSAAGQSITLQFSYRNLQQSTVGGNMDIGLYNVGSTISANSLGGPNPLAGKVGFTLLQNNSENVLYGVRHTGSGVSYDGVWYDNVAPGVVVPYVSTAANTAMVQFSLTLAMTAGGLKVSTISGGNVMPDLVYGSITSYTVDTISIFGNYVGGAGSRYSIVDNVIVTAVPEPATWALLALSLTTVMVLRRRRA